MPDAALDPALSVADVLWEERTALARPPASTGTTGTGETTAHNTTVTGGRPDPAVAKTAAPAAATRPKDAEIYRHLKADNHWALCLSGGGIRSAAFALGVIQRFAFQRIAPKCDGDERGSVLQQFEYLSTVSGGGYIGSWLSAWLFQQRQENAQTNAQSGGANTVIASLNERIGDHAEVGALSNLRRDSHYLAPSFSAISPDLWSGIAGIARNLCLNWIIFIPPMILAVLISKALGYGFIAGLGIKEQSVWFALIMVVAAVCLVAALSFSVANRPSRGLINASQAQCLIYDLAVFLVGAALLIFVLASPSGQKTLSAVLPDQAGVGAVLLRGVILGVGTYLVAWIFAPLWSWQPNPEGAQLTLLDRCRGFVTHLVARLVAPTWKLALADLGSWCVAGAVFGTVIAVGFVARFHFFHPDEDLCANPDQLRKMVAVIGVAGLPWIVSARLIADVIFISFAERAPTGADAGLEYQARSGGIFTLALLGWLIWFGIVLWAPLAVSLVPAAEHWITALIAGVGGVSGAFSVIVGSSSKTGATLLQEAGKARKYLSLNTLAAIAAAIFAAALVALLSIAVEWALSLEPIGRGCSHPSWLVVIPASMVLAILIAAVSLAIGINRYSLHSIYRNRLVRAFLGASRDQGKREEMKNRFTDFDSKDSPFLHQLWTHRVNPRGDNWKPLHIINAALNLVSSQNLAWQERMAAPFTFSPLHCGSGSSIFRGQESDLASAGAYRRTSAAANQAEPYGGELGLTLGTAMAISGAAVSPNMGYNTSPGVEFLMALFNVRLGWWLPNPRYNKRYWHSSPLFALYPYCMEMFGLTSETKQWVYLSDGGHFENLGIYEMVRRRCRVIVVSDAGCDPDYTFDDLGNALRKVWIDLGVRIEICGLDRLKKRFKKRPTPATPAPYWAVGRIRYNAADHEGEDGWLLYLKSGLHGTEPMDVLSYALSHPSFPHEPTANQFFTESQFESYRRLGYEIAGRALEAGGLPPPGAIPAAGAAAEPPAPINLTLDTVIRNLEAQCRHTAAPPRPRCKSEIWL
jgi:hypothetical protein